MRTEGACFYTVFHGTGRTSSSGPVCLTIAGAMYCLSGCRISRRSVCPVPYACCWPLSQRSPWPAVLTVSCRFKLLDSKCRLRTRGLATGGHGDSPLAQAASRGCPSRSPWRVCSLCRLPNELRQPADLPPNHAHKRRLHSRRTPFPREGRPAMPPICRQRRRRKPTTTLRRQAPAQVCDEQFPSWRQHGHVPRSQLPAPWSKGSPGAESDLVFAATNVAAVSGPDRQTAVSRPSCRRAARASC